MEFHPATTRAKHEFWRQRLWVTRSSINEYNFASFFSGLILLTVSLSVRASEVYYRKICRIDARSDTSGQYRVLRADNLCVNDKCTGFKYEAMAEGGNGGAIKFISAAKLIVGSHYHIFANKINAGYFSLPGSADDAYLAPLGFEYFVEVDGVFGVESSGTVYRDLPAICFGGGEGCEVVRAIPKAQIDKIMSVRVVIPNFIEIKKSCKI